MLKFNCVKRRDFLDRLDKTVAKHMNISRSAARQLIRSGAVEINGKKIFAAEEQLDINRDELRINGKAVAMRKYLSCSTSPPECSAPPRIRTARLS